jgi:hypothetical protein
MVDNTIALQVRPFQMPNVGEIYGQAQNIQMNRMRMAEAQETAQERNALRGLLSSGVDLNTPEGMAQLRRAAPMLAPQIEQRNLEGARTRAQTERYGAQAQVDRLKMHRDLLAGVNSPEAWASWRAAAVRDLPQYESSIPREFSPQNVLRMAEGAEGLIRRASEGAAAGRPNEFERALINAGVRPGTPEWQTAMRTRAEYLSGARPETPQVATGPDGRPMLVYPRSGAFTFAQEMAPGGAAAPTAAPPIDLRRPQAATPAAPAPANMMLPGAAAATLAAGPGAAPVAAAPTTFEQAQAARGARAVQQAGAEAGATEAARLEARSAATRREEAAQLERGIAELRRISEPGGLLERSTGSGVGRLLDIAGEFVGVSSRSSQAAAALAPIADIVLKLVPRFEGPQSDRDTRSYQEAAGRLADPTIPNETRLAAAREIIRLMEGRRDQFGVSGGAGAPAPGAQPARTGQTQAPTAFREGQTATGPNGQRIEFKNGQWVPMR